MTKIVLLSIVLYFNLCTFDEIINLRPPRYYDLPTPMTWLHWDNQSLIGTIKSDAVRPILLVLVVVRAFWHKIVASMKLISWPPLPLRADAMGEYLLVSSLNSQSGCTSLLAHHGSPGFNEPFVLFSEKNRFRLVVFNNVNN